MVACLERTDGNTEFHQIVDFLTFSTIYYALTVSPTIYASYIEQFWATAKSKTVNDVKQIHAKFDGKTVVISESSVRSDLHFNDEDVPPVVEGEGSGQPSESQPTSSTTPPEQDLAAVGDETVYTGEDDEVVRAATTAASLEAKQESGIINKTQSTTTLDEPSPQGTGSGNGPRHHVTILGDTDAQTRFETASIQSHDPPLSEVNTSGSGDDSMEHQDELTNFIPPTPYDLPLSGGHIPGSDEDCSKLGDQKVAKESQKIRKEAKEKKSRDEALQDWYIQEKTLNKENDVNAAEPVSTTGDAVNTANVIPNVSVAGTSTSAVGPSTSTAGDIFEDEMTTMADILMAIRRTRPRTTSVVIHNVEEEPRRAKPPPAVQSQDKEMAQKLYQEEQAQFEREQKIAREKAAEQEAMDAALIEQMEDVQARIDADALLAKRLQQKEREQFTVDEQARMLVDLIAERKRKYPLIQEMLSRMLNRRLEINHESEMALELIRFIKTQLKMKKCLDTSS
uniref:Retrovirus-related Pol polyprotein from transposon TNT 1-94 n=1 Tax=Tanacetum cinerariifolium TaxID=118510 RepID=A0A6L2KYI0_TANCI|nr:retrovirus-related Pol polyprotein from transposon TNT 1-94 [Tanacetum cinerariifolium]